MPGPMISTRARRDTLPSSRVSMTRVSMGRRRSSSSAQTKATLFSSSRRRSTVSYVVSTFAGPSGTTVLTGTTVGTASVSPVAAYNGNGAVWKCIPCVVKDPSFGHTATCIFCKVRDGRGTTPWRGATWGMYDKKQCYIKALEMDGNNSNA